MGMYLRKTIPLGLFKLHITNSGLGLSVGVKGARIFFGPYATYLDIGQDGVYYSKRLGKRKNKRKVNNNGKKKKTIKVDKDGKTKKTRVRAKVPFLLKLLIAVSVLLVFFAVYLLMNSSKTDNPASLIAPSVSALFLMIGAITDASGRKKLKNSTARIGKVMIIISILAFVFALALDKSFNGSCEFIRSVNMIIGNT